VVVLEHARVADAFSGARVQAASLLATQAATALENAVSYAELSSSHRRLEQLVEERTAELAAANRARSDFLSSMSHELRTPLNGILGYAQILERSTGVSAADKEGARVIRKSGDHLLALINDVLDLARIEAGSFELLPGKVHVPFIVRTVTDVCRVRAESKGLSFRYEQHGAALGTVLADGKRLTQVLLNLLGNAIESAERGQVALHIDAGEACAGAPRRVRFRVEDDGRPALAAPPPNPGEERSRSKAREKVLQGGVVQLLGKTGGLPPGAIGSVTEGPDGMRRSRGLCSRRARA
jgi:signal transduction histidine kinase